MRRYPITKREYAIRGDVCLRVGTLEHIATTLSEPFLPMFRARMAALRRKSALALIRILCTAALDRFFSRFALSRFG